LKVKQTQGTNRAVGSGAAIAIGAAVAMGGLVGGPISGASMNPPGRSGRRP
jgi:glycerol uptake facilitator-like aquaporin